MSAIISDINRKDKRRRLLMMKGREETILFAEDDGILREMIKEILVMVGYDVLDAMDGDDALRIFKEHRDRIQLLILDVVMPKRNGKEVYFEVKKDNPLIKTVFISGYPANVHDKNLMFDEKCIFISKPFVIHEFLVKIREVLNT